MRDAYEINQENKFICKAIKKKPHNSDLFSGTEE